MWMASSRACLGGAVDAAGTQVGLLKQISAVVAVRMGRGCGKTTNWAREKRLRERPTQHSAEMAIFAPLASGSPGGFGPNPSNPMF